MLKKQKNIIPILAQFIVFMLIHGLLIGPVFALNSSINPPEHLSPRINISNALFSNSIKNSYSEVSKEVFSIRDFEGTNLLDISYQKKQSVILEQEIIANFEHTFQINKDKELEKRMDLAIFEFNINYDEEAQFRLKLREELEKKHIDQVKMLKALFSVAKEQYENNQFSSGEFYYNHALEVAEIAARNKAGFIGILAAIFHRMPTNKINPVIVSLGNKVGKNRSELFRRSELKQINSLIKKFSKIVDFKYKVHSQGANSVENFMGAPINTMQGDFRVMRLVLADKQAAISHASEIDEQAIVEEIQNIYGPFAGRFGLFDLKKKLENYMFKIHNQKGYDSVMQKVYNTYGLKYEELSGFLNKTKMLVLEIANVNQIDATVSARVKTPYRIHVKEKIARKGQDQKDTLYGVDTIGIKVVCKTEECFYRMNNEIRRALDDKKLGNWKIGKIKKISSGITYINLKEIEGNGNLEVQFLTKQADDLREINFAHWSYEISRQTGLKQKFDKVEDFEFYKLIDEYQAAIDKAAIDNPKIKEVDLDEVIEEYFKRVYEHNKQWVYIYEKSSEIIDGKKVDVVKPKRLPREANGPVFAAQTGVDFFDENYAGVVFYEWRGSKLVKKTRQYDDLKPLKDGDIIEVKRTEGALSHRISVDKNYQANLLSSIREFLRPRILLAQIDLSQANKRRYDKNAQSFLETAFKQKRVIFGSGVKSKFPLNAKYMQKFLKEFSATKKLENSDELMLALALQLINSSEVVDWARKRGLDLLKNKIPIDDKGIQAQLGTIYGSFERILIEVGMGKTQESKVVKSLKAQQRVNVSFSPTMSGNLAGIFEYSIKVNELNKKAIAAKIRTVRTKIIKVLNSQGIEFDGNSFNEKKSRRIRGGFLIIFEIPVRYDQLPNIRKALLSRLETKVKLKTKRDKKEREKAITTIGLMINIKNKNEIRLIVRSFAKLGPKALKEYNYDQENSQLSCIFEYDQLNYDLATILNVLNVSNGDARIISVKKLQKTLKKQRVPLVENIDLIESAI